MAIGQIDKQQVEGLETDLTGLQNEIDAHEALTNNPHSVTAAQVGAIATTAKGAANGVAELDSNGKIPSSQIPALALERLTVVADQTARFALTTSEVQDGDVVKQTDTGATYVVTDDANLDSAAGYTMLTSASAAPVDSVFGRVGAVVAVSGDYDSDKIDNSSTVNSGAGSVSDALESNKSDIDTHTGNTSNPHGVTAAQVGAYTSGEVDTLLGDVSNLGGGTVDNTEFGYLNGVTSNIQAQLTAALKPAVHQTPSGTANGSNTDWTVKKLDGTTTVAADPNRSMVTVKRVPQIAGTDFTWESGNTVIRFATAPPTGWPVQIYGYEA